MRLSIPVQRAETSTKNACNSSIASHVLQFLLFPAFALRHARFLLPDGANLGLDRLQILVERSIAKEHGVVLGLLGRLQLRLGDTEMQVRSIVGSGGRRSGR